MKGATAIGTKSVPNVLGYDAPSAIKLLEERGLNVEIRGSGRVTSQSLPAGSIIQRGSRIVLNLKV